MTRSKVVVFLSWFSPSAWKDGTSGTSSLASCPPPSLPLGPCDVQRQGTSQSRCPEHLWYTPPLTCSTWQAIDIRSTTLQQCGVRGRCIFGLAVSHWVSASDKLQLPVVIVYLALPLLCLHQEVGSCSEICPPLWIFFCILASKFEKLVLQGQAISWSKHWWLSQMELPLLQGSPKSVQHTWFPKTGLHRFQLAEGRWGSQQYSLPSLLRKPQADCSILGILRSDRLCRDPRHCSRRASWSRLGSVHQDSARSFREFKLIVVCGDVAKVYSLPVNKFGL